MKEDKTEELLEKLIELQTGTMKLLAIPLAREAESQAQLVVELSDRGFENHAIADILGASYNSVRMAVNRAKKSKGG